MDLDNERESSNVEDERGQGGMGFGGGGFGGGGGLGGILGLIFAARGLGIGLPGLIVIGLGYFLLFGGGLGGGHAPVSQPGASAIGFQPDAAATAPGTPAGQESQTDRFVRKVLATTEDTWGQIFQASGQTYEQPKLHLYSGQSHRETGCGIAQSSMGPFYCPNDHKVYLDESFFDEMTNRFGVQGQFADAYVIAHEIGHHVQNLTGQMDKAKRLGLPEEGANGSQVRIELQADCYAGVWGNANKAILAPGDVDQALRAANAIGDDTLQRSAGRAVTPDSFTHGTSTQRVKWFKRGYEGGDVGACDTYSANPL